MLPVEQLQLGEIVLRIVVRQERQLHQPAMDHQEHQHVDRPMPGVVELLLLNRPRDRAADRVPLQDLAGRDLIDTHYPDALFGKPRRIRIAPKDLLRPLLEPGIHTSRLPVAGAMGLQINSAQDVSHGPWADVSHDPVRHGLAGQVITRPMRDVQPFGHGLQASQLNDLCPLHRRDPQVTSGAALPLIGKQAAEPPDPIPLTGSPDGGFVALEMSSEVFSPLASGDSQNNSRTSDLIPRRRVTVSDPLQLGHIRRVDRHHLGLAATHAGISHAETGHRFSISGCSNSVQVFVPETVEAQTPGLSRGEKVAWMLILYSRRDAFLRQTIRYRRSLHFWRL